MSGLYTADKNGRETSYKSGEQIRYEALDKGVPVSRTPLPEERDFEWWQQELIRRRDTRLEYEGRPSSIDLEIPTDRPICVSFMGDQHVGGMYHDYEMMGRHVQLIQEHPLMYVALGGDVVNGMYWNPGQDQELDSFWEQVAHARAMMDKLNGKILYAVEGDHDMWAGKSGVTMYHDFLNRYKAHLLRGVSTVNLKVGDQPYSIVTAHRFPGNSIYNKSHPANRAARTLQGADIYVGHHTHQKGASKQPVQTVNGTIMQHYLIPGPYKYSDEYAQKNGWAQQDPEELGAYWVVLHPGRRNIEVYDTAQAVVERLGAYL